MHADADDMLQQLCGSVIGLPVQVPDELARLDVLAARPGAASAVASHEGASNDPYVASASAQVMPDLDESLRLPSRLVALLHQGEQDA